MRPDKRSGPLAKGRLEDSARTVSASIVTDARDRRRARTVRRQAALDLLERLARLVTAESLRLASELAAVGIATEEVPRLIAHCLRQVADGLESKT
jgi:hypothetical protein